MMMRKKTISAGLLICALIMATLALAAVGRVQIEGSNSKCFTQDCMPECLKMPTASASSCEISCEEFCREMAGDGAAPDIS